MNLYYAIFHDYEDSYQFFVKAEDKEQARSKLASYLEQKTIDKNNLFESANIDNYQFISIDRVLKNKKEVQDIDLEDH